MKREFGKFLSESKGSAASHGCLNQSLTEPDKTSGPWAIHPEGSHSTS